uniref:Uncharacterized protein n=1 Tax=uncultured Armatimonadetes bacterium TaxID=157466 RepID=A0A6J4HT68_9BACT|nr:hypothetical protein AVDCRST_MAG63-1048 [uncultured Armatimonadetes bacterium]
MIQTSAARKNRSAPVPAPEKFMATRLSPRYDNSRYFRRIQTDRQTKD